MASYQSLDVSPEILQAVKVMGFEQMTEIQEKAIPVLLEGKEVIAKAPTGTGKTCAFGVPMIEKINRAGRHLQGIVLCPTRELAVQIVEELRQLAYFIPEIKIVAVYGGQPIDKQIKALKDGAQIVVATPGRMLDHMQRRTITLSTVKMVVLDEADEMLDMGFYKDVCRILDKVPKDKQMAMFSATISREVMDIGWLYQRDTVELTVEPLEESAPRITQYMIESEGRQRFLDMVYIIQLKKYTRAIVFCNTRRETAAICKELRGRGFNADCLHGDMTQSERNKIMAAFRAGNIDLLVATDVAARGIDVDDVDAVFNYEIPNENEYYTHRIGRTGRAKREGTSYIFYSKEEITRLRNIIKYARAQVTPLAFGENDALVEVPMPWPDDIISVD